MVCYNHIYRQGRTIIPNNLNSFELGASLMKFEKPKKSLLSPSITAYNLRERL
jgi:hypothetical protein